MAQGISKGSAETRQSLDKTLSHKYKGIENNPYQERAKLGGEFLQSFFNKEELHYFRKTELKQIEKELKQREAQDRTRTIEARERKAEAMLNAFKSSQVEGRRFIKNAFDQLGHIQDVFKGMNLAGIQAIKNPLLQSLASLAGGYGNKKDAAASFASQVLKNPTSLFADFRQAKFFVSRFLRQHGLGSLSRMLRRRGRRAQEKITERLQGYQAAFHRSVEGLSKQKRSKKVFVPPPTRQEPKPPAANQIKETANPQKAGEEKKPTGSSDLLGPAVESVPTLSAPVAQSIKNMPPPPPPLLAIKNSTIRPAEVPAVSGQLVTGNNAIPKAPPLPGAIKPEAISLDELEQRVIDLRPIDPIPTATGINPPPLQLGAISMDDLDAMLVELEDVSPLPFNAAIGPSQLKAQFPEKLQPEMVVKPLPIVPSTTDEELDRLFTELGGGDLVAANFNRDEEALNRLLAELEDLEQPYKPSISKNGKAFAEEGPAHPSQGNPVNGNHDIPDAPPLPGNPGIAIPPPPPPPPLGAAPKPKPAGSRARVAAEGIKTLNELVPVKPADNKGRPSIGKCEIAPQDIHKVQESVFQNLSIDKLKAFSPEQIASLTEEQQKAIPAAVISLVVARAMQAPGGLNSEQREERNTARKALACLDPKIVREALEKSQERAHKLYIEPKTVRGTQTDDLTMAYREIRRDVFKTPYKPGEALSRLTPEQIAESKVKQQASNGANPQNLFDQIHAGKVLKKTVIVNQAAGQSPAGLSSSTENTKEKMPKTGDGAVFSDDVLNKGMNRAAEAPKPSKQPMVDLPESDDSEWEDDGGEDSGKPKANNKNSPHASGDEELGQAEIETRDEFHLDIQPEAAPMPEKPEVAIAEAATQAVQIGYKMSDIQKNVDLAVTVEQAVEAMVQTRRDEKMQALSDIELKQLSGNLESIALTFYRENQIEWMKNAQIAARKAAQDAAVEAIRLGKSQEETQATAQDAAQVAAEKAVIKAVATAVKDHNDAQINALIKSNTLGNRRRAVEDDDESNNADDDDDFWI